MHAFDAFMSPGGVTERISCFIARYEPADRKHAGGGVDADEHIEVIEMAFEDALRLIAKGDHPRRQDDRAALPRARRGFAVSEPDDAALVEAGRKLFAGEADFFFAAAKVSGLPDTGEPEIAFAGRSNVGKSPRSSTR